MKTLLSVIVPVYNAGKYVESSLTSILPLLRDERVELIIVNDGSTDDSMALIEKMMGGESNYKFKIKCH